MSGGAGVPVHAGRDAADLIVRAWDAMGRAVHDRHHGFHTPVVCTLREGAPDGRVVVLRRVEPSAALVMAHVDVRSPKAVQVSRDGESVWVFYDAKSKLQVRTRGQARVEHGTALADEQWARSTLSSRRCYLAPRAPGTQSDGPDVNLPTDVRDVVPSEERTREGRANFGVLVLSVRETDVLHLAHDGHLRAIGRHGENGDLEGAMWVAV